MDAYDALSRVELLVLVRQQAAALVTAKDALEELRGVVARLETRIKELERRADKGGPRGMPGLKPEHPPDPKAPKPRKPRTQGFARPRSTPTEIVDHAVAACPECGTRLGGGSVKRTREVLEITPSPVRVIEHRFLERECPVCRKSFTPAAELGDQVLGQQRLGIGLLSVIVSLREVARIPVRTIQWYLETVHGLRLSLGTITTASQRVAAVAQPAMEAIRDQIRASPAVHADETGWRTDGHNGYIWIFGTEAARYFLYGRRTKDMVDTALGPEFDGVLISDFYGAYTHYPGLKQRCWAHLLREIHELRQIFPDDAALGVWADAVHDLFLEARDTVHATPEHAARAAADYRARLLELARPYAEDPDAPARKLAARMQRFLGDLFVFVADPHVAPTNNLAERGLRPLVTRRKISGGSRSEAGTAATMVLASVFGTWLLQGQNPVTACRSLLAQA